MVTMKFEGMNDWFQTKDLYIVDRGFRDVIMLISRRTGTICKNVHLFEEKKVPNSILQKSPQNKDMMDSRNHF